MRLVRVPAWVIVSCAVGLSSCDCGGPAEGEGEGEGGEGEGDVGEGEGDVGEGEGEGDVGEGEGEGDLDPAGDADGDGRSNGDEVTPTRILIDASGFGLNETDLLTERFVTSNPRDADSDDDGLDDRAEFLGRTDPSDSDTDDDGLSDADEVRRWGTSPVSVDSDGDARGDEDDPQAPDADFFDGAELNLDGAGDPGSLATSPSLADTDGDGVIDSVEEPNPTRSAVVADLPAIDISLVDDVDIRLRVSYTDSVGTTEEFGTEVGSETSNELSRTDAESLALSASLSVTIGAEVTAGLPPSATVSASATATAGIESTRSTEVSQTTARSASETNSLVESTSSGREVSTESGSISVGIDARNTGDIAYRLQNLSIAVRQYDVLDGDVRSLAIMTPNLADNTFTLAAGQSTGVVPFSADDLDVDLVRGFLRNPTSLIFEPIGYDLQNADGTSFVFLTEDTFARTALLVIDRGQGDPVRLRVATNVDRDDDGDLLGLPLGRALEDADFVFTTEDDPAGIARLTGIGADVTTVHTGPAPDLSDPPYPAGLEPGDRVARRFWVLFFGSDAAVNLDVDFADIRLKNGDEARLLYGRDEDRDGIFDREEYVRGASDATIHSDGDSLRPTGDGLSDYFEIRVGWEVEVTEDDGFVRDAYVVYPSPALVDSDEDGFDDGEEFAAGSDPHLKDTDFDGLEDDVDPDPVVFTNTAPVNNITIVATFGTLTATGSVVDAEGNLERVEINWGDGQAPTVITSGFGAINASRTFAQSGDRTVTVTSRDRFGAQDVDVINATVVAFPTDDVVRVLLDGNTNNAVAGAATSADGAITFVTNRQNLGGRAANLFANGDSGSGGVVTTGNLGLGNAYTVSAWINLNSGAFFGNDVQIAGQRDWYGLVFASSRVRFGKPQESTGASDNAAVATGQWIHYAGSYSRTGTAATLKLYKNGALIDTRTVTENANTPTNCRFAFGSPTRNCTDSQSDETSNNFNGSFDNVRVFRRVLSDAEVAALATEDAP